MSFDLTAANVTAIDTSQFKLTKASPEEIADFHNIMAQQYVMPEVPELGDYAKVYDNHGRLVATLSNEGYCQTNNSLGGKINTLLKTVGIGLEGPALAQARAEALSDAFNGSYTVLDDAMTQSDWTQREPITWRIDEEALTTHGYQISDTTLSGYDTRALAMETVLALMGWEE